MKTGSEDFQKKKILYYSVSYATYVVLTAGLLRIQTVILKMETLRFYSKRRKHNLAALRHIPEEPSERIRQIFSLQIQKLVSG
jgi:hypothetical protein